MDPTTQTQQGGQPPVSDQGFVPGPFGGQVPTPPVPVPPIADPNLNMGTMPPFQFDSADFSLPTSDGASSGSFGGPSIANPNDASTSMPHEDIADPFAGGIASVIPPAPTAENTLPSFDLPSEPITQTTEELTPSMPSFDLPTIPTAETEVQSPEPEAQTTEAATEKNEDTFELPSAEQSSEAEEQIEEVQTEEEQTETTPDSNTEEEEEEDNDESTEETIPAVIEEEVDEEQNNEDEVSHGLSDQYREFTDALEDYLSLRGSDSANILGHRSDSEEVNYEFSQYDSTISVIKHLQTLSDGSENVTTLQFDNSDGLRVSLNDDLIAHYGVDEEDGDTTYHLNDKLSKFTTMLLDAKTKEEKALKEAKDKKKKYIETLRSF